MLALVDVLHVNWELERRSLLVLLQRSQKHACMDTHESVSFIREIIKNIKLLR